MTAAAGFPIDIVVFGIVAALLVYRLRSILGKRTGFEQKTLDPQAAPEAAPRMVQAAVPVPVVGVPEAGSPLDRMLAAFRRLEPGFDAARFLGGAEAAFRLIVLAFARGDRVELARLLGPDAYASFEQAIAQREAEGLIQHGEILEIGKSAITDASLNGTLASVSVTFSSEQVSYTTDAQGNFVAGHDGRTAIDDVWTFERVLGTADPTWKMVAARHA